MHDKKKRLVWAALAALLPGPWTPVIMLAYILGRAAERGQDTARHTEAPSCPPPDPYACGPASHGRNRCAPAR
ncbi:MULTISPECIES: hypothetical protein [Amycolatopsis]|uniref:Uncharacterized protein n=1 Tax=Amycolatopsis albidoflavus TaxID=102226 RepID=A0ABW5IEZ7_9PSEU